MPGLAPFDSFEQNRLFRGEQTARRHQKNEKAHRAVFPACSHREI
jgi:hypothetical protein